MIAWITRTFGLPGSWSWACRQMRKGRIVFRKTDTGAAKYKLDREGQKRIVWCFRRTDITSGCWQSAYIFLSDFICTSWAVWDPPTSGGKALSKGESGNG